MHYQAKVTQIVCFFHVCMDTYWFILVLTDYILFMAVQHECELTGFANLNKNKKM